MAGPLFTLLQLNDVHLTPGDDPRNTRGKFQALLDRLGEPPFAPRPDAVLLAGDLVDLPEAGAVTLFREMARPLLGAQTLAIPGNHDACPPDAPPPQAPFFTTLEADPIGQAVLFRGVLFLLLNNADGDQRPGALARQRNRWLAGQLRQHADRPKIIAAHVPLVALRDPEPLAASFNFPTYMDLDPHRELLALIEAHAASVIAVLSGHLHLTARVERAGIQHIVPSGLMSWPHDAAFYQFFPDRIEVRMASLPEGIDPGSYGQYPLRNGVHDRHGRDFADARHPTLREYITGLPEERAFTIPLAGKKALAPGGRTLFE